MEQNSRIEVFDSMPVPKAIALNAIPAVITMVVIFLYNIVDTFFVGQTGDPLKVAAVSLATPVFMLLMAAGNMFGIGGTSLISRALGEGREDFARKASSFCFWTSLAVGFVLMFALWAAVPFLVRLIGASADTAGFAREYLVYVAPSAPFVIMSAAFSYIVRAEGKSNQAVAGVILGTVVNIILDPVMILGMRMGVAGAAVATVIGNMAGAAYYVVYFLRKRSRLSISLKDYRVGGGIAAGVLAIGVPAALIGVMMDVSQIVMNNLLAGYGDIQVAAMGVAFKSGLVVVLLQLGLGQGIQPLLGYNYGSGNIKRARQVLKLSVLFSATLGTVLTAVCWWNSGPIVGSFINSPEVRGYGVHFMKAMLLTGPVIGVLFIFTNALQAMGAAVPSFVVSLARQGLVFIPLVVVLNRMAGLTGIIYAQPTADVVSIAIAAAFYAYNIRRMKAGKLRVSTVPLP